MRKFLFVVAYLVVSQFVVGQVAPNYRFLKSWRVSEKFAKVDSIPVDTMHLNFQDANPIDRFSISNAYNGNLGSPIQSKLYFDRPLFTDFIFSDAYTPYMMDIQHATFFNTKTPYSNLNYTSGGTTYRKEDNIKFLFTANANKKLNIGTTLDYIYAIGEYDNQSVKRFAGSLFGTYDGKHYSAIALLSTNNLSNFENGGITKSTYITDPVGFEAKDIPVNLNGFSNYKKNTFYYNQRYTIGIERPVRINPDSVRMDYVPVTGFAHTLKVEDVRKRYYESTVDTSFYANTYQKSTQTNDSSSLQTFTNNFSITMEEEFNKWMKFGLTAFVEHEYQRFTNFDSTEMNLMFNNSTKIGGILSKQRGNRFKYKVLGEVGLLGYKAGNFLIDGDIGGYFKLWNDSITLVANGFVRSDRPSPFLQSYYSNHFIWNNNFDNVYRTHVGGTFSIPTRSFSVDISVENITKNIYFNTAALPTQFDGNIQVVSANFNKNFHLGKFTLENNVVYQLSSLQNVLPLPTWALYHNLYFHDKWFNVLSFQMGANVRYHSAYNAPLYMPATGQFYVQTDTEVGNYPLLNVYLNFHLKRTRFFIEYYNLNQKFADGAYFSMPNYPLDPAIMKIGVSWNFYD